MISHKKMELIWGAEHSFRSAKNSSQYPVVTTTIKASFFSKSLKSPYSMNTRWVFSMVVQGFFHQLQASTGRVMAEVLWKVLTVGSFWWSTPLKFKLKIHALARATNCDVGQFWGMLHWRNMFARWSCTCLFSSYVDLTSISELGSNCPFAFNCAKKWDFNFLLW